MRAQQLVSQLAQRGPAQGGASPDAAGQQLSQQMSELNGADPQMMLKAAEQMKAMALAIQVRVAFQVPEAARHMAQAQKSLDAAIKSLQQAAATSNTVSQPIVNQAGMPPTGQQPNPANSEGMMPNV
jgi:hypothetical protein